MNINEEEESISRRPHCLYHETFFETMPRILQLVQVISTPTV